MSAAAETLDPWAEAAALIADVGRCAQSGLRYRDLAAIAEPAFDRAVAIGSEVRRAARAGATDALPPMLTELRGLLERCERAIADVGASARYRELVAAFETGDADRACELAAAVFAGVTVSTPTRALYCPVAITRRSAEHFLPVPECAELLQRLAAEGLEGSSEATELGSDGVIRPLRLVETPDEAESPLALAFGPDALPHRMGRVTASETWLVYAPRLRAPFTIVCAPRVSDEWWKVRPDAYRRYVAELRAALTARSLDLEVAPEQPDET